MRISSEFVVGANPSYVFETLLDPLVMRDCIPGCTELFMTDETHYKGKLTSEIAHVKFNADFVAELTELDKFKNIKVVLSGDDRKLATAINVVIALEVVPIEKGSKVRYDMDLAIRGRLGRLGEPIIRRRSAEVERDFVTALTRAFQSSKSSAGQGGAEALSPSTPPAEVSAAFPHDVPQKSTAKKQNRWLKLIFSFFRRKS